MRFFKRLVRDGEGFHVYNIKILYPSIKVNKENQNISGKLLEIQDIDKPDSESWTNPSNIIFRASMRNTLKNEVTK